MILDKDCAEPYYIFEPTGLLIDLASIGAENWLTRDPRGILAFVRRYGLLWHGAVDLGTGKCRESLSKWWYEAADIMWMLDLYKRLMESIEQDSATPLHEAIAIGFAQVCQPEPISDEDLKKLPAAARGAVYRARLKASGWQPPAAKA